MKFAYILTLWFAILISDSLAQDGDTTETNHAVLDPLTRLDPCFSTVTFYQWNGNEYTQIKK